MSTRSLLTRILPLVAVAAAILIVFLATRERLSDEEQIRRMFIQAEKYANQKNMSGLLSMISQDYRDEHELTYSEIRAYLFQWRRSSTKAKVTVYDLKLRITGKRATVNAAVAVEMDSTNLQFKFRAELAKEKRVWRITSTGGWQSSTPDLGF